MDVEVKKVVKEIRDDYIDQERIRKRKEFEDAASRILASRLGKLTLRDIEKIIELLDSDYYEGQKHDRRFGLALWGRNRKLITSNDLEKLNELISEVYGRENLNEIDTLKHGLKGVGNCFISSLLYLKNKEKYSVFIGATVEGVKAAFSEEGEIPSTFSFKDRYGHFNKLAQNLKEECGLEPQEVDIVLTVIPSKIASIREAAEKKKEHYEVEEEVIDIKNLSHYDVQGILLELGNMLRYETYVADPSRVYKEKPLKELASLETVPPFTHPRLLEVIKNIDVIWFLNEGTEFPIACFEVEHTTDVTKGLQRLYHIKSVNTKLFIVAPSDIESRFQSEISKDPFYKVRDRFLFRTYEQLIEFYKAVKKYRICSKDFLAY